MKKFLVLACVTSVFLLIGNAWAVTITYTADNITDTWYIQGETGPAENIAAIDYRGDWRFADTETLVLTPNSYFTFVWSVTNIGEYSANNPAGFLAQIDLGHELVVTDASWQYSINGYNSYNFNADTWNWQAVTAYGNNGGDNIWTNVFGSVEGISQDAQWIWSADNFADGIEQNLFIRVDVKTAPVPEPITVLLLGTGLFGIAVYRLKKK